VPHTNVHAVLHGQPKQPVIAFYSELDNVLKRGEALNEATGGSLRYFGSAAIARPLNTHASSSLLARVTT